MVKGLKLEFYTISMKIFPADLGFFFLSTVDKRFKKGRFKNGWFKNNRFKNTFTNNAMD